MAGERKENSVLFTLKELKDITADDQSAPTAAAASAAPGGASKATPKRTSSFIDEADSLLADIRDTVGADAAAEAERIEAQRRASEDAERQKVLQTRELQQADIQARLAAEDARRKAAAEEREARRRAIDIAERRARGEHVEEDEPVVPAAVAAPVVASPAAVAPPPEPTGRGTGFYLTVVGLPVLCLTAVAIALILKPGEQIPTAPPPPTEPAKVAISQAAPPSVPSSIASAHYEEPEPEDAGVADASDAGAADAEVEVAAKDPVKKGGVKKGGRKGTGSVAGKGPSTPTSKESGGLKLNIGGDSGGKGGITF